jgi:hypothetical protein
MSAGMWIKWERGLIKKPEIMRIAKILEVTKYHAAACCMQVWEWAEDVTVDGIVHDIDPSDVSDAVGVAGIGEAMCKVDWLTDVGTGISFPKWDRHNGDPAKRRAEKAEYMRDYRRKEKESQE